MGCVSHTWLGLLLFLASPLPVSQTGQPTPSPTPVAEVVTLVAPAVVLIRAPYGTGRARTPGSGFIASDGRVITNAYVVSGASGVEVYGSEGQLLSAVSTA
jgi:S1-C subfamily serine protease